MNNFNLKDMKNEILISLIALVIAITLLSIDFGLFLLTAALLICYLLSWELFVCMLLITLFNILI